MKRKLISGLSFIVLLILITVAFSQRQLLKDTYIVRTTDLQPASAEISDQLSLTTQGSFLYEASQPEVQAADVFNASCRNVAREHSIVLGCYTQQRFFVFDVKDERLSGVKQVTAAHELLHAVYERMPQKEKQTVNTLLLSTAESINTKRFKDTLEEYKRTEPDQIENELHSILGTEIEVLPTQLEEHYAQYFSNRKQIVSFAKQYEETFTNLDDEIKQYDSELTSLREQKEQLEGSLKSQQSNIELERARLDSFRSSNPASYNAAVPGYNQKIQAYNQDIAELKILVARYNELVEKRNLLATTQNDLVKQLDSSYQPLE